MKFKNKLMTLCMSGLMICVQTVAKQNLQNLPAYKNSIQGFDIATGPQQGCTITTDVAPIAFFAPINYQESLPESLVQTYFFPRTRMKNSGNHQYMLADGGVVRLYSTQGKNYGTTIEFNLPQGCKYRIVESIDKVLNRVQFDFVEKM